MKLTDLAAEVARREGGRRQVLNVAQAAEALARLGDVLFEFSCAERQAVVKRLLASAKARQRRRAR